MQMKLSAATAVAVLTLVTADVASAQQGEYIVSSQVVSDEVISGGTSSSSGDGQVVYGGADAYQGTAGVLPGGRQYGQPNLFQNQYTQGGANGVNAQMYLAPGPVPPNVGHTFYTYQPFMPHEMLYPHTDRFHNYYNNGRGMNRTKVRYSFPPVRQAVSNLYWNVLRIPR